jgi:hypothetical protein
MKLLNCMGLIVGGMLACAAAQARTISYDCGQYNSYKSVDPEGAKGLTVSFSPGVDTSDTTVTGDGSIDNGAACEGYNASGAIGPGGASASNPVGKQWMEQGNFYNSTSNGLQANWEVVVTTPTASNPSSNFTVEFLYNTPMISQTDAGCKSETATLHLSSGASYSLKDACGGSGDYLFTFTKQGQLVGSNPFSGTTTTAAPEIDSKSAIAGVTLLLGLIAVLRGRRRSGGLALQ